MYPKSPLNVWYPLSGGLVMKRQVRKVIVFFFIGLFGITVRPVEAQEEPEILLLPTIYVQNPLVGPVEAQEGQKDVWSNFTSRLAEVLGVQTQEAATQGGESSESNITPSHVFQATLDLIAEIEILREVMAAADFPGEAEPQEGRAPIHAYAKAIEMLGKVARIQRRLGMEPVDPGPIPIKNIVLADVLREVQTTIEQIREIKTQLGIEEAIEPAPLVKGKTPSLVYKNLRDASLLLNGLVGRSITPNDIFEHLEHIYGDMELIAAKLNVSLDREPPAVEGRKTSMDVARLVLRASYKIVDLQNRLGMDESNGLNLTIVRATSAENFEVTNIMLVEMARIKAYLNINLPHEARDEPRNKRPTDVFAQVLRLIKNLNILAETATKIG